jgi:cell division protein FtsI (penicillin-binding protein 3)
VTGPPRIRGGRARNPWGESPRARPTRTGPGERRIVRAQRAPRLRGWFIAEEPDFRARGIWLLLAFAAMAVILTWRLFDVQVRQGTKLSGLAASQHALSINLPAHRGRILDVNGRLLASDTPVYSVFADPGVINPDQRHPIATALASLLGMGPSAVEDMLTKTGDFVYVAHQVPETTKEQIDKLGFYGIGTIPEEKRVYQTSPVTGESFAANLLGYVNHDGTGQYGVEGYYDKLLRGIDGKETTLRDSAGNSIVLSREQRADPHNGSDLRLGLDSTVQYWAEQTIAQATVNTQSESGEIIIMDTHTGAIRGWAQYPTFDANRYASMDTALFRDRSIADLYEPGSVMKVVTYAGGLETKAITPTDTFNEVQNVINGVLIHDSDNHGHGVIPIQRALDESMNNGAIHVMQQMGPDAYYKNLLTFGIGSPTGVDLAGEVSQPVKAQKSWIPLDYAEASYGQSVVVTPLEMIAAVNAVGNGGVWVQPHAVEAVVDPATGRETPFSPASRRVISTDTAQALTKMLTGVVDDRLGSGVFARIPAFKYDIAGKTGTASVAVNGHYIDNTIDSFVGYLPANNPQFTMLVVLRLPQTTSAIHEGAYIAAPIWKQMAQTIIDTWKILP